MGFPFHVVDDFIPEKIHRMKNIHPNLFPHFDAIQSLSLEELVPVMVSQYQLSFFRRWHSFCYERFFSFIWEMIIIYKISIIRHVFIVVWKIPSLGPFCWRVLSDCTIMQLEYHVAKLPTYTRWSLPRAMTSLRQANIGNEYIWKIFFTFDFHILPEQTHRWQNFSLSLYFNKKDDSLWSHVDPFT